MPQALVIEDDLKLAEGISELSTSSDLWCKLDYRQCPRITDGPQQWRARSDFCRDRAASLPEAGGRASEPGSARVIAKAAASAGGGSVRIARLHRRGREVVRGRDGRSPAEPSPVTGLLRAERSLP